MAAEYAAKLALLHEESAARAEIDRRKRRERYIMLADLQAQAKVFPQLHNVECGLYVKQFAQLVGTLSFDKPVKHALTFTLTNKHFRVSFLFMAC